MNKIKSFLFFLLTAAIIVSQVQLVSAAEQIDEIRDLIQQYYVEDVPSSTLSQPTIKEITERLDPYSVYMTKQEFERFTNTVNQEFVGIGVELEEHERGVKVIRVIPNGPAERAGLVAGDIITHVDGKNLQGESLQTAVYYISGEANTSVTITFLQKSTGFTLTKSIERKRIFLPNVEAKMIGGDIGYIQLHSFSINAADQLQTAIQTLNGAKGYILDLRNNGGGYVSAAQKIAGLFPNVELAFQLKERSRIQQVYRVIKQEIQFPGPVHILINGNSASASEMVAASVKEQDGAVLYGQTSYGKGSMQTMFVLSDQSVLKLTTAKFFSPQGIAIDKIGVAPNILTERGMEFKLSHRDHLISKYNQYKQFPSLKDVPTSKTFTVKMNMDINPESIYANDIQFIHLGGEEIQTKLTVMDNKTIKVTPEKPLVSKENYLLVIHPNWKSNDNKSMSSGYYVEINVE